MKSPRINLVIDRDKAAAVGLNATIIQNSLYDALGPKWSSTIYGNTAQYARPASSSIRNIRAPPTRCRRWRSRHAERHRSCRSQSVVQFKETVGPQSINHSGQLPSVSVSFGLKPGVSLGAATAHVKQVADRLLPPNITTSFEGSAKVFQQSMTNLGLLLFIAIGVVYIVLGALYESYIHPLTILSGLPSAGPRRARHAVSLRQRAEHLLVRRPGDADRDREEERDHADRLRARRRAARTARRRPRRSTNGCIIRFRPIMMTTMAALLGVGADRARLRRRR